MMRSGTDQDTRRRSTIAGLAIAVTVGWNISNVSSIAPLLAADYRTTLTTVGLLTTVVFAVHTLMQLPSGRGADRFGPRRVCLVGLAVLIAANGAALAANATWLAFITRSAVGLGTGLAFLTGLDYLRRSGGSPLLQGVFGGTTGAGSAIAFLLMPQLEPMLRWRAPFLTAAVCAALALGALAASPKDTVILKKRIPTYPRSLAKVLLRDRRLQRLGLMNMASSGLPPVIGAWVVALLVRAGGFSGGIAGVVGALTVVGSIVSFPLSGWIVHHRPKFIRLVVALSVVMGTAGTIALAESGPLALALTGSALVGLASGLPWAYAFTTAAHARPDAPGTAIALVNTAGLVVSIAGISLMGLSFSFPGEGRLGFVVIAVLWACAIFVLPQRHQVAPVGAAEGLNP
jgi:MFS family permease